MQNYRRNVPQEYFSITAEEQYRNASYTPNDRLRRHFTTSAGYDEILFEKGKECHATRTLKSEYVSIKYPKSEEKEKGWYIII